jgi:hypothetical protein
MDIFKDEIIPEIDKIQKKLAAQGQLSEEEIKIILLSLLKDEDAHENSNQ